MKITIAVPEVTECSANACAFNTGGQCHAKAITVGDAVQPICDTFLASGQHSHRAAHAGVGACKVAGCRHNEDFECNADSIHVFMHGRTAECQTFAAR
jgi:hypothetical protein